MGGNQKKSVNNIWFKRFYVYICRRLYLKPIYNGKNILTTIIMNKTDLTNEIAAKAGLNKVAAKAALDACLESISQALANEDKVQLIGFGTFSVVEKPERQGINPQTKQPITIAARKVVKFKPGSELGK